MPNGFLRFADIKGWLDDDERERSFVVTNPNKPDNPIVYVSKEFTQQTGYARAEALGRNCRFLQGAKTDRLAIDDIRRAISESRALVIDIRNYRKDGTPFWNRLRIRPLPASNTDTSPLFLGVQNPIDAVDVRP